MGPTYPIVTLPADTGQLRLVVLKKRPTKTGQIQYHVRYDSGNFEEYIVLRQPFPPDGNPVGVRISDGTARNLYIVDGGFIYFVIHQSTVGHTLISFKRACEIDGLIPVHGDIENDTVSEDHPHYQALKALFEL